MGEASGKSQKPVKDAELQTEFLIINKREDRTLHGRLGLPAASTGCPGSHPPSALRILWLASKRSVGQGLEG